MTLTELKGKYERLREEIDRLGVATSNSLARHARLMSDLDQIDAELAAVKRHSLNAPTLRDVVSWIDPAHQSQGAGIDKEFVRRVA
jgi:hypothetical protein